MNPHDDQRRPMRSSRTAITAAARGQAARAAAVLLGLALVFSAPGGPQFVAAQTQQEAVREAQERLSALFTPLETLRGEIDASAFDVEALSFELAFEEAEGIVAHVHETVRFEPYHGLLRGAHGTLASGGGNALDQALLTAVLLSDAGYEVEIRGTTLDDQRTAQVLAQLRAGHGAEIEGALPPPDLGPDVDFAAARAEAEAALAELEADAVRADGALALLVDLGGEAMQQVEAAAREYHWVAYRLFDGDGWTDAHPVFGQTPPEFAGLEATERFDDEVPADLQHRFRFQVFVERRLGDQLLVEPVTGAWERPVANTYGVAITYANVPDGLEAVDDAGDVDALLAATSFFFPMLNGDPAPGGMAFDMLGSVLPPEAATSPFAAIFQSAGRSLGGAAGMLGGIGVAGRDDDAEPHDDFVSLTAQWFEFTFIAPGGEEVTHRRLVTDRLGAEAREDGALRLDPDVGERDAFGALASVHTFMVDPGRYAEAYVLDRTLGAVLATRDLLDAALVSVVDGVPPPAMPPALGRIEEPIGPLTLFGAFRDAPIDPDVISYRPAPGLVVMSQRIDGTEAHVDVVANPRWSLRTGSGGVRFDAAASRRAGVWETRTESIALAGGAEPVTPAFELLDGVSVGELVVLDAGAVEVAEGLAVPREARDAIRDDLARGYAVVVAPGGASQLTDVGWWRVDPVTGETLGRGGDGRGQSFVEYLTSFEVSIALTAGFTVFGVHQCTKIEDARVAGCCIIQNVAMAGAGVAIGVGAGIALGAGKALLIFGVMDVGYNVGGLFVPTVCA